MGRRRVVTEEVLQELYVRERLSTHEIAARLGVRNSSVLNGLRKFGIPTRSLSEAAQLRWGSNTDHLTRERLEDLYVRQGLSGAKIAELLGVANHTVTNRLAKFGITRTSSEAAHVRYSSAPIDWDEVRKLAAAGVSAKEISNQLGRNYTVVQRGMKEREIPRIGSRGPVPKVDTEEAIFLSDSGWTYQRIAEKYGVTAYGVYRALKKVGYKAPPRKRRDQRLNGRHGTKQRVLRQLLKEFPFACMVCDENRVVDMAHIIPDKEGGPLEEWNVLLLCPTHHRCQEKGLLHPEEWGKVEPRVHAAHVQHGILPSRKQVAGGTPC